MAQRRKVFLTGGAGMVGAALAGRLVRDGHEVWLLLREGSNRIRLQALEGRVRVVHGDVRDSVSVQAAVERSDPGVVYHLASTPFNPPIASHRAHIETIVMGMLNVLEAVRGRPEVRVIATGSGAEYGSGSRLREDQTLQPGTVFGAAKAAAGLLVQTYGRVYGMRTVWLRLFTPYGPWERPQRLVPHTILSALNGQDVTLTGGSQQRDFIYLEDAVEALVLSAETPLPPGAVFNIGSGVGTPVRELVERLLQLMGSPARPLLGAVSTRPDEIMEISADITSAREQLGWEPRTSLTEGLSKSIAWWTEHRDLAGRLTDGRAEQAREPVGMR